MTTLELKDNMLAMLANIKERPTLELLHRIMLSLGSGTDWCDKLSSEQQSDLRFALEEIKSVSNLISNDEAIGILKQWSTKR